MSLALSWALYWIGDGISRTALPVLGRWLEWQYRIYNWCMVESADLQDGDTRGPWRQR
jgi:hypothetical protein